MLCFDFREDSLDLRHFERDLLQAHWLVLGSRALSVVLLGAVLALLLSFEISLRQDIRLRNVDRHVAEGGSGPVNVSLLVACPDDGGVQLRSCLLVVQLFFVDDHAAVPEINCINVLLMPFGVCLLFRLSIGDYDVFLLLQGFFDA